MTDSSKPADDEKPAPGGAAPEMDKIRDDPKRDSTQPPATRRTVEVEQDEIEETEEQPS